ncbi:aminoglycoside phosphotransferase family protein [Sagittula sp. SSi028]|uniref:aminoglycoside phosphotransferase family protein n=1 Tax=Sagittula sp. SSi028 TaxID=3400636 RepID=UPI003AF9CA2F
MSDGLQHALAVFGVMSPQRLARTGVADIYRVRRGRGRAVVKIYRRGDAGNEATGLTLMQTAASPALPRILSRTDAAVLIEYLDGPTLGQMSREGRDDEAAEHLARTARVLHLTLQKLPVAPFAPLDQWLTPLWDLTTGPSCPADLAQDMQRSIGLARRLLATTVLHHPLHGDLHHDNVILTADGPRAFDAKGLVGDPAFELANALRNPKGIPDRLRDPDRIRHDLTLYAKALKVPAPRLAAWAAVKCAHSIALRSKGPLAFDTEADLLQLLLAQAPDAV